ncbi:MAG: GTP cyclohydrolase II [Saprospirales bacterium]|nr:GTP cyclohydrolase II [Saprospirales bacterium]MBK8491130.1 GTP cyclohydrolase II [Saprospirales bacterium]
MKRQAEAIIPTPWGEFSMIAFSEDQSDVMPHLALVHERIDRSKPVLVRIHSECLTGDLFGSLRCDCGEQLIRAMELAAEQGGVVVYLRQEGRGIGLINKLKAYTLQDQGMNTLDANAHLGLEVDGRHYEVAIAILQDLGIEAVHLLTNNPTKLEAIERSTIRLVSRVPIIIQPKKENWKYLKAKQELMGHFL